ncbi:MAG: hypothetical protein AAF824_23120 [Bacteroidota bacterium]
MKPANWLFLLVCLTVAIMACLFGLLPSEVSGQGTHSEFSSMRSSGWILTDFPLIKGLTFILGLLILGIFTISTYLGVKNSSGDSNRLLVFIWGVGFLLYSLMYGMLLFSHVTYIGGDNPSYLGGLPAPTAWMLYGLGVIPIIFTLIYIFKFDQWVLSQEDLEAVKALMREQKEH